MTHPNATTKSHRRSFTLLELLIVIGILTILSVLTVISVGGISRDIKLSTGINRVMASLAAARAEAIRSNTPVLVSFRVTKDNRRPGKPDQVEMVIARFTGEIYPGSYIGYNQGHVLLERYEPVPEYQPQLLPAGIKVAGPYSDFDYLADFGVDPDSTWCCMSSGPWMPEDDDGDGAVDYFTTVDQGEAIGVLFAPDGSMVSRDPNSVVSSTRSSYKWVDHESTPIYPPPPGSGNSRFFQQKRTDGEALLNMCHFLTVYDEQRAMEEVDYSLWVGLTNTFDHIEERQEYLGTWINEHADRIHFNKYTGIAKVGGQ